jgi:hypothetical protein
MTYPKYAKTEADPLILKADHLPNIVKPAGKVKDAGISSPAPDESPAYIAPFTGVNKSKRVSSIKVIAIKSPDTGVIVPAVFTN